MQSWEHEPDKGTPKPAYPETAGFLLDWVTLRTSSCGGAPERWHIANVAALTTLMRDRSDALYLDHIPLLTHAATLRLCACARVFTFL